MPRALIFQHMAHDTAGRFLDFFAEDGIEADCVWLWQGQDIPSLAPYDLMMVLGGAQDVWQENEHPWLAAEKAAIREWVGARAKPYIGLCLGHQLLADAMGGTVGLAARGEIGVHEVTVTQEGAAHPLYAGLGGTHAVMQWHYAEVEAPPPGAAVLAGSPHCAVQSFSIGGHAVGYQFHAEFTPQSVASWASMPNYLQALERALGPTGYADLRRKALPLMPAMGAMTRTLYENFARASGLKR